MKCSRIVLLLALAGMPVAAEEQPPVTPFSGAQAGAPLPSPWRLTSLPGIRNPTRYSLARDDGVVVLRADAQASMASVVHPLTLDPKQFPLISWRWKISNVLRTADMHLKSGDDFPARVYVLFDYDTRKLPFMQRMKLAIARQRYGPDIPAAALCYVWDGKAAPGATGWSTYADRVRMIVVESGAGHVNAWRGAERNIVADYRAAFGEDPPAVSGVAIVSDTDNTGESVTAMYGDIRFHAMPATQPGK